MGKTYVALADDGVSVVGFVTVSAGQVAATQLVGRSPYGAIRGGAAIATTNAPYRVTFGFFREIIFDQILNKTVERGRIDTATRIRADTGRVFRYAIVTGRVERDPTADLAGALPSPNTKHRATLIEPKDVAELLRAIDGYGGTFVTRAAFKLAPLVFLRPGELVRTEWAEFDLDAGEWRILGERMKMKGRHIVPLSKQAWDEI